MPTAVPSAGAPAPPSPAKPHHGYRVNGTNANGSTEVRTSRSNGQAVQEEVTATANGDHNSGLEGDEVGDDEDDEDDDDWLMSDDEIISREAGPSRNVSHSTSPNARLESNGESMPTSDRPLDHSTSTTLAARVLEGRDSAKVQRTFYDVGYREGITAGKLSTLQAGFDQGFNLSAPLGRARGDLRGQVTALNYYLNEYRQQKTQSRGSQRQRGVAVPEFAHGNGSTARLGRSIARTVKQSSLSRSPSDEDKENAVSGVRKEALDLLASIEAVTGEALMEPDWEALQHEEEHAKGPAAESTVPRSEDVEEKHRRERILPALRSRTDNVMDRLWTINTGAQE